ncbi:MAG: hypothetical protein V1712_00070 [Patescibacteria group bacterium]
MCGCPRVITVKKGKKGKDKRSTKKGPTPEDLAIAKTIAQSECDIIVVNGREIPTKLFSAGEDAFHI